jgi:Josephin
MTVLCLDAKLLCVRTQQAFICNFREHWFTIRRLGYQWFNLNSMLSGPELLSDTHLALFLKQLQQEGQTHECHMSSVLS